MHDRLEPCFLVEIYHAHGIKICEESGIPVRNMHINKDLALALQIIEFRFSHCDFLRSFSSLDGFHGSVQDFRDQSPQENERFGFAMVFNPRVMQPLLMISHGLTFLFFHGQGKKRIHAFPVTQTDLLSCLIC
jgi:hypothetical protein